MGSPARTTRPAQTLPQTNARPNWDRQVLDDPVCLKSTGYCLLDPSIIDALTKKAKDLSIFARSNRLSYRRASKGAENWSKINRFGQQISSWYQQDDVRIPGWKPLRAV